MDLEGIVDKFKTGKSKAKEYSKAGYYFLVGTSPENYSKPQEQRKKMNGYVLGESAALFASGFLFPAATPFLLADIVPRMYDNWVKQKPPYACEGIIGKTRSAYGRIKNRMRK